MILVSFRGSQKFHSYFKSEVCCVDWQLWNSGRQTIGCVPFSPHATMHFSPIWDETSVARNTLHDVYETVSTNLLTAMYDVSTPCRLQRRRNFDLQQGISYSTFPRALLARAFDLAESNPECNLTAQCSQLTSTSSSKLTGLLYCKRTKICLPRRSSISELPWPDDAN